MIRDINEIQALATKYTKQQLSRMAQMGLIDPTKAVMAGMMIDRISKSNAQPPQTTVAEDALAAPAGIAAIQQGGQQPQPQSAGVAALPSGITEMAGGGIVAFADGGDIPGYAGGGAPASPFSPMMPAPVPRENQQIFDVIQQGEEERRRKLDEFVEQIRAKQLNNIPLTPAEQAMLARSPDVKAKIAAPAPAPSEYPQEGMRGSATFADPFAAKFGEVPQVTPAPKGATVVGKKSDRGAAPKDVSPKQEEQGAPLPSAPKLTTFGLPAIDKDVGRFAVEPHKIPEEKDVKTVLKEQAEAEREAGVKTDIYQDMIKDLEGKKGKLANRKQEAIGMALMQTGLGLIGARRGQEFVALGEAGQRALQGLVSTNEKIRETEDKLDDSRRSLLIAENDYRRTRSDKALSAVEKRREKIEELQSKNVDNRNKAAEKQAEIDVLLRGQSVQMRGQDLGLMASKISAASANRPGETERLMAEYQSRVKTDGQAAADAWLANLQMIRGAGKPQNTFSFEEAMKIVAANPLNAALTPDQLAAKAKELMAAGAAQQRAVSGTVDKSNPLLR